MKPVWIVDDDKSIRWVLEKTLSREQTPFKSFSSASEALSQLDAGCEPPQVLVSDIRMPGESGLDLLKQVKLRFPSLPVIIMTAYSDLDSAVAAFQGGAFEYLPKPFDVDEAVSLVKRANQHAQEQQDLAVAPTLAPTPEIIGEAPAMQEVFRAIGRLSQSQVTVLITGESGTGKELVARAIHYTSPRKDNPFVSVNCMALNPGVLESELFGHEKGSFTGAVAMRRGRFEQADGGTLFLDEVGDLSAIAQAKVLRALQEGEIQPLGDERRIKVDVRLVCATNRPLEELVEQGLFREDLYYRINVFPVFIPPLRERPEDILPMVEHFIEMFSKEYGRPVRRVSTPAIDILLAYHWPGNVRELRNVLERAVLICDDAVLRSHHLPGMLQGAKGGTPIWTTGTLGLTETVANVERELIVAALGKAGGNIHQAARDLNITYRIIYYKMKKYDIDFKKYLSPSITGSRAAALTPGSETRGIS